MPTRTNGLLEAARAYARAALSVVPQRRDKSPASEVLPLVPDPKTGDLKPSWRPFQSSIADDDWLIKWFADAPPDRNIAIVTGIVSGGLDALDFDEAAFFERWLKKVGTLADGLVMQHSGRGTHVFFRCQHPHPHEDLAFVADDNEQSGRHVAVETRGEGHLITVAPSLHANGKHYEVIAGSLLAVSLLSQPQVEALLRAARELDECPFTKQQRDQRARAGESRNPRPDVDVIGAFNDAHSIEQALEGHGYHVDGNYAVRPGGKRKTVYLEGNRSFHHNRNDRFCDGYWHRPFSIFCELDHGGDVRSAVKAAAEELGIDYRTARGGPDIAHKDGAVKASKPTNDGTGKTPKPTDDELRERYLALHPNTAYGLGEFRRYGQGIWQVVDAAAVQQEVVQVLETAKQQHIRPSAAVLSSVSKLLQVKVSVPPAKWDADPNILVVANGTLEIATRQLRDHSPDDYATTGLAISYDLAAKAPAWEKYLNATIPHAACFLQEFAGYAMTTDTSHELAVYLNGPEGSGKSTFVVTIQALLGSRCCNLGLAAIERSQFALTTLPGKTLAVSTEQPGDFVRSVHLLNAIISGETITVDRKFRDPVDIIPRAKVLWAMNALPRVPEGGVGLFRRVKVVPFKAIPEDQRDPALKRSLLQELPGILNWALDGLTRLKTRGRFELPTYVVDATTDFRFENDLPQQFVDAMCVTMAEYKVQSSMLYQAYCDWCRRNHHKAGSMRRMAEEWRRLGFEHKEVCGLKYWCGVGLRSSL
jgi:P4 family phage/plasmid primase-like protien